LLDSPDGRATLVKLDLTTPFLDRNNPVLIAQIEGLLERLVQERVMPAGLDYALTGSAVAGRDLDAAQSRSVRAIEFWTIVAVVVLLLLLYRAPLLAVIPLVVVFVGVQISLGLIAMMAQADWLVVSRDARIFVTVLSYGAGVDYCVFLIARYREELFGGTESGQAMSDAIAHAGEPVAASAATVICGIAVLAFMQFGKIREAGLVIPFALTIVLAATLTLSTALLRLAGKAAFWPGKGPARATLHHPTSEGSKTSEVSWSFVRRLLAFDVWSRLGPLLLRWPGAIWLATVALMAPFAVLAVQHYDEQNYNPLSDLPADSPSVLGSKALEKHFPPGVAGPITVLLRHDQIDFTSYEAAAWLDQLTKRLEADRLKLRLADIRTLARPLGVSDAAEDVESQRFAPVARSAIRRRALAYYVSQADELKGRVTRLELVLSTDPFLTRAIGDLHQIEQAVRAHLPAELAGCEVEFAGNTVGIRDLADVKRSDQRYVEIFVPLVILALLWFVLRRLVVSIYLVLTVLFSYLTTLGLTVVAFRWFYAGEFTGLDWKVPVFLFTILVAVGEDYNIFLVTRIKEEQRKHGPRNGILRALISTGQVISSCGFIMAGTFASLLSGSLLAMQELGFALTVGILLDTLVVRPILVPTFLVLLQTKHLGRLGKALAFHGEAPATEPVHHS
jgi:RND superfamily putative drug exporter